MPSADSQAARLTKLLIPIIVLVAGVGIVILLFGQLQETKQRLAHSQQEASELQAQKQSLEQQLEELRQERQGAEERLLSLRSQLNSITAELERSRADLAELNDRYETLNTEKSKLQEHMSSLTNEKDAALKNVQDLEKENSDLKRAAKRFRSRLALLDRDYRQISEKLAKLESTPDPALSVVSAIGPMPDKGRSAPTEPSSTITGTVELPPIVVRKDSAGMSVPVHGRVVEVNDQYNFAIIDKGGSDGVRVGMVLDLMRGSGSIGRATVIRVRPNLSACEIIRSQTSGTLETGDLAIQSGF